MQLQIRKEQNIRKEDSGEGEACMGGGVMRKKTNYHFSTSSEYRKDYVC